VTYSRLNAGGRRGSFYQRVTAAALGSTASDRAGIFADHSVDGFGGRSGWWSIWAFPNLGNGWRPRLFVEFLNSSNAVVGTWDTGELPTPAANAWIRHTVSGTIPTAAVLARGYYWMQRNAAAALSVVSLDDAMFSVGEVLPEWTGRGDELLPGVVGTTEIAPNAATDTAASVNWSGTVIRNQRSGEPTTGRRFVPIRSISLSNTSSEPVTVFAEIAGMVFKSFQDSTPAEMGFQGYFSATSFTEAEIAPPGSPFLLSVTSDTVGTRRIISYADSLVIPAGGTANLTITGYSQWGAATSLTWGVDNITLRLTAIKR
jgi:hypothetical protein